MILHPVPSSSWSTNAPVVVPVMTSLDGDFNYTKAREKKSTARNEGVIVCRPR